MLKQMVLKQMIGLRFLFFLDIVVRAQNMDMIQTIFVLHVLKKQI